jgi:hypothetical protein
MLVTKSNYVKGDIIGLKLVNGDEVIAELTEETEQGWALNRPTVVVGGAKGIGLIQAMFSLSPGKSITVRHEHVMMTCEAVPELRDHYLEVTTGIKPVSKGSIIV